MTRMRVKEVLGENECGGRDGGFKGNWTLPSADEE